MNTELVPCKSVGEFLLGSSVELYLSGYDFDIDTLEDLKIEGQTYSIYEPEEISLNLDNELNIESIMCYSKLMYKGENLIGKYFGDFLEIVNSDYVGDPDCIDFEEGNDVPQYVYEFEEIGLQVWTRGEKGIVLTIIVDSGIE